MNYETKFDLGQTVWRIGQTHVNESVACGTCAGHGHVSGKGLDGEPFDATCPTCAGRGCQRQQWREAYHVIGHTKVGQIQIRHTGSGGDPDSPYVNYGARSEEYEERYMLDATGVGSGSVWDSTSLFTTEGEAEAECERRNATLHECERGHRILYVDRQGRPVSTDRCWKCVLEDEWAKARRQAQEQEEAEEAAS